MAPNKLLDVITSIAVNPDLVLTFSHGKLRGHLPSSNKVFAFDASAAELLVSLAGDSQEHAVESLGSYSLDSVQSAVTALLSEGVLLRRPNVLKQETPAEWQEWGDLAWRFHLGTRAEGFLTDPERQDEHVAAIAAVPHPPLYKCTCPRASTSYPLPAPRVLSSALGHVLLQRRTCRNYAEESLDIHVLSDLLFYTGGFVCEQDTGGFGRVLKKCAPSPGARHGTELYPIVARCTGIESGIYHYCVQHHRINAIEILDVWDFLRQGLSEQPYFADAPLAVLMTLVRERYAWKYKRSRMYRMAHIECGHYAHNFLLAGTSLGLGVFSTGALDEPLIEEKLGLNHANELVMYCVGAGQWGPPEHDERRYDTVISPHLGPDALRSVRIKE
jgi:SagB-type dehydrogenase family enzyme